MNLLYIHTHDTGRFIQPYGHAVPTPNLMALAAEGTVFRKAFCVSPTCTPSRSGLLTGAYPHENGLCGLTHRGFSLKHPEQHLAHFLNDRGFETVLAGIQHEAEETATLGYRRVLGDPDFSMKDFKRDWVRFDTGNAREVAAFLKEKHDRPFFLAFGMFNTHRDYPALPETREEGYVMPPPPIADTPENRHDWMEFINSAKVADDCVGTVLRALREAELEDDTLVLFTTDHGPALPEMKQTLYDFGAGVSFIVRMPGSRLAGRVSDALVSQLDFFPTVCEFLGVERPAWTEGVSLMPLFRGEKDSVRDAVFTETNFHAAYEPMRAVRTERYKYIRRFTSYPYGIPANTDGSPDKKLRMEHGFYGKRQEGEKLYDLLFDPCERNNLAGDPEMSAVRGELAARLDDWMRASNDPLLAGTMPLPVGAKIQYPDSNSNFDNEYVTDPGKLQSGRGA